MSELKEKGLKEKELNEKEMDELNEMEVLEKNIIKNYNELLKTLWEEGDMDTLEKVISDDQYREELMEMHKQRIREIS